MGEGIGATAGLSTGSKVHNWHATRSRRSYSSASSREADGPDRSGQCERLIEVITGPDLARVQASDTAL